MDKWTMANDVENSPDPSEHFDKQTASPIANCSVCKKVFISIKDCLKHELLFHSLRNNKSGKKPSNSRLKAANKFLNSDEKQEERKKIQNALQTCENGKEFDAIFRLLCMDNEYLDYIYSRIETCIIKDLSHLGNLEIFPFGSIASGLALRDCDIDIYIDPSTIHTRGTSASPRKGKQRQVEPQHVESPRTLQFENSFNRIIAALYRSSQFSEIFGVRHARVPIIRCTHCETGFSIDINVCGRNSLENTQFVCELVESDPKIRELLLFLKLWAKNMQIIGKGNMTSYCLITMVIFYLQQPYKMAASTDGPIQILKPVMELQRDCESNIIDGIDYAFDLQSPDNKPCVPSDLSIMEMLKGFFYFYSEFKFDDFIISPFLGQAIPKSDFTKEKCKPYRDQLASISNALGEGSVLTFKIDRSMCVQDSFALNHNVAPSVVPAGKQHFMLCLENAINICQNQNKSTIGEILEKLLYETPPEIVDKMLDSLIIQEKEKSDVSVTADISHTSPNCVKQPTKAELKQIAEEHRDITDHSGLLRIWCSRLIEAIPRLISDFYHIDFQTYIETPKKQQRLDNNYLSHQWQISSSVDLWSTRCFQKTKQSFYDYQMEQTMRLYSLRRQDAKYSIQLKALFTIRILPDYTGINISVTPSDGGHLSKKDPLQRFFNIVKSTMQNFNYKELLEQEKRMSGETMEKLDQLKSNNENKKGILGFG